MTVVSRDNLTRDRQGREAIESHVTDPGLRAREKCCEAVGRL